MGNSRHDVCAGMSLASVQNCGPLEHVLKAPEMSELIRRARSRHAAYDGMEPLFGELADEIERLKGEIESWKALVKMLEQSRQSA